MIGSDVFAGSEDDGELNSVVHTFYEFSHMDATCRDYAPSPYLGESAPCLPPRTHPPATPTNPPPDPPPIMNLPLAFTAAYASAHCTPAPSVIATNVSI